MHFGLEVKKLKSKLWTQNCDESLSIFLTSSLKILASQSLLKFKMSYLKYQFHLQTW